jgi:hypothetical protein
VFDSNSSLSEKKSSRETINKEKLSHVNSANDQHSKINLDRTAMKANSFDFVDPHSETLNGPNNRKESFGSVSTELNSNRSHARSGSWSKAVMPVVTNKHKDAIKINPKVQPEQRGIPCFLNCSTPSQIDI